VIHWAVEIHSRQGDMTLNHECGGFHTPDEALAWVAKSYDFLASERVDIALTPQDDERTQ
jgi:hypothetical protein